MSTPSHNDLSDLNDITPETLGQKTARWIDDPVGSVVIGTALPAAAVSILTGGIYGLTLMF
jgi:hypothetical protein